MWEEFWTAFNPPKARTLPTMAAPVNASENFTWAELACRGDCANCSYAKDAGGPVKFIQPEAIRKLQLMRKIIGQPLHVNSAARCPRHNAAVGGAPLSQHRSTADRPSTAFDIKLTVPKQALIAAAEQAGFKGLGINYKTFLHVDNRSTKARW